MFESSIKILKIIEKHGYEAYIVGGFARDRFLGKDSADVDICTNATPKELKAIFKDSMLPKEEYGSINVIYNKIRFDITTFREDIKYVDSRRPEEIKYIDNLKGDLLRRDFIINTLCINSSGEYVDLLNSREAITSKIIKTVGNADTKIEEDALRILRAVRFATTLNFSLDEELKEAIKKHKSNLLKLSSNRKKEELDKIFNSINVKNGISLILELGLDEYLDLSNLKNIKVTTSSIGIWSQLDTKIYNFSQAEKETINKVKELINKTSFDEFDLYNYGLYVPSLIAEINDLDKAEITKKYMNLPIINRKQIMIDGNKICEILNIKPSKIIKEIYADLENKIISNNLKNNTEDIINYILKNYSH